MSVQGSVHRSTRALTRPRTARAQKHSPRGALGRGWHSHPASIALTQMALASPSHMGHLPLRSQKLRTLPYSGTLLLTFYIFRYKSIIGFNKLIYVLLICSMTDLSCAQIHLPLFLHLTILTKKMVLQMIFKYSNFWRRAQMGNVF